VVSVSLNQEGCSVRHSAWVWNGRYDDRIRARPSDDVFHVELVALVAPDTGMTRRLIADCEGRQYL
jgi:hypothetical protein